MSKKRYAVCGVSSRAIGSWIRVLYTKFSAVAELVGMLDADPFRKEVCNREIPETENVPFYSEKEFDKMIEETRPDALFVVCMDRYHADYIIRGLEHHLEVITEKPMTTCWEDAVRVREAEKKYNGRIICTFNYRYNPVHRLLREAVIDGKVGKVTNVDLTWYIDIHHGSSYFQRWNRMRENSGSLSIHKSSHHFDLVNWWIDGVPTTVHAMGALNYYGPDSPFNPSRKDGRHCCDCEEREACPYYSRWNTRSTNTPYGGTSDLSTGFNTREQFHTIYRRDNCIFDSQINIYDTYIANVRYANGALLNYSANFSTPYEGYRLAINGTHGRLETEEWGGDAVTGYPSRADEQQFVDYYPIFGAKQRFYAIQGKGGHGGGDPVIQEDVFLGVDKRRPYKILADSFDGLAAIAIGDAVYKSIRSGEIIDLSKVVVR